PTPPMATPAPAAITSLPDTASPTGATPRATPTSSAPETPAVAPSRNRSVDTGSETVATPPTWRGPRPASRTAPRTRTEEPRQPSGGARCSDILQKASLEPLTTEE